LTEVSVDFRNSQSPETDVQHDRLNPHGAAQNLHRQEQQAADGSHDAIHGYDRATDGFDAITKNIDATRLKEQTPGWRNRVSGGANQIRSITKRFKRPRFVGIRQRSSLVVILFLLFGGGRATTFFLAPGMAIVHLKEVLVGNLNDQLAAVDKRAAVLLRSKMQEATKGSCGLVKIHCRFNSMTDAQAEKFRKAGIEVERKTTSGFGGKRGQITSMKFLDEHGNVLEEVKDPKQLQEAMARNLDFKEAVTLKGFNAKIKTLNDAIMDKVTTKNKTSKANKLEGNNKDEIQKSLDDSIAGKAVPDAKSLTPHKNEKGEITGYTDEKGTPYTVEEVDQMKQIAASIDANGKIGSKGMVDKLKSGAVRGISAIGYATTACRIYTTSRAVAALAKVKEKMQLIRFAMTMVLTPADMIKAGAATDVMTEFVGDNITATTPEKKVVDESKWSQAGSADNPPMITDPDAGKNATDSPGVAAAAYDEVPKLNARAQRFKLGGALSGALTDVNRAIATVVNGGNPDPKQVSQKCHTVDNQFVQLGAFAAGIGLGVFSFGVFTGLSIAGSGALEFATPYLESWLADIMAGNITKGISGVDTGDAAYVGTSALLGDVAQARGMKPLDSSEAMNYLAMNQDTENEYARLETREAASTPFDIYNQYSFMGSIARSFLPYTTTASHSLATMGLNVTGVFSAAFATLTPQTHALSADRFKQCDDPGYQTVGIEADVFCNVRYGMTQQELNMDPLANADWMAATGNIDPESEDGVAVDNKQSWNYVKFLKECVNRTAGWGEEGSADEGDGSDCRDPQKEPMNMHFRVYTMDQGIDKAMDEEPKDMSTPGTTGFTTGETGAVNSDGWAFPTTLDAEITSGFGMRSDGNHEGIDLAQPNETAANKPIFAARDGKVVAAGPAQGFGNWIVIAHTVNGQEVDTLYGHMYDDGVLVKVGDPVKAGQQIGKIGSNGQSTGPHLHFGIWVGNLLNGDGKFVNPEDYDFIKNVNNKKAESRS
jgi:hypothetical protein